MLLQGARRIAVMYAALLVGTAVLSAAFGLLAGASLQRSLAVGYYVVGALLLVGCFVMGAKGPLRGVSKEGDTVPTFGARRVRRATEDERKESTWTAILLFGLGLSVVVIGSLLDPTHTTF